MSYATLEPLKRILVATLPMPTECWWVADSIVSSDRKKKFKDTLSFVEVAFV